MARPNRHHVFINVPYDREYEDLYLALIAGLASFGLIPRATLEIPTSERRLSRIVRLLRICRVSFHDISRVELDRKPPPTPRFNMPFELGLAVALSRGARHDWYVYEAKKHRANKSLSDLDGTDIYIHGGTATGVLRELMNALSRRNQRPRMDELLNVSRDLRKAAQQIKRDLRTTSLYGARAFSDLRVAATRAAQNRIASVPARF